MTSLRSAWRKRLAVMLRRFRRLMGRWPDRQVIRAAKHGVEQAINLGMVPPLEH